MSSPGVKAQNAIFESVCKQLTEAPLASALQGNQLMPSLTFRWLSVSKHFQAIWGQLMSQLWGFNFPPWPDPWEIFPHNSVTVTYTGKGSGYGPSGNLINNVTWTYTNYFDGDGRCFQSSGSCPVSMGYVDNGDGTFTMTTTGTVSQPVFPDNLPGVDFNGAVATTETENHVVLDGDRTGDDSFTVDISFSGAAPFSDMVSDAVSVLLDQTFPALWADTPVRLGFDECPNSRDPSHDPADYDGSVITALPAGGPPAAPAAAYSGWYRVSQVNDYKAVGEYPDITNEFTYYSQAAPWSPVVFYRSEARYLGTDPQYVWQGRLSLTETAGKLKVTFEGGEWHAPVSGEIRVEAPYVSSSPLDADTLSDGTFIVSDWHFVAFGDPMNWLKAAGLNHGFGEYP